MFAPTTVIAVIVMYMTLLFLVAQWVEHRVEKSNRNNHPLIYALSYNVYSTSWAFYGAVGYAVGAGWMFTAFDSGAIFGMLFATLIMGRMIRLKQTFRLTSIADLLSTRYNRSQTMAIIVTLVLMSGVIPYIALQLKAVVTTYSLLTYGTESEIDWYGSGMLVVILMTLFTVIFGVRRLDPTERHQGMMAALALECVVKVVVLITIGLFVVYVLHDGVADLFARLPIQDSQRLLSFNVESPVVQWSTNFVLGFAVIYLLPRQYHVGVVENANENHLPWLYLLMPAYLFLMKLFVLPLAAAGLVMGIPIAQADTFVLQIPMTVGSKLLAMMVFIGGFSAATAMVMVSTMTMSTMTTNHLLLPIIERLEVFRGLRRYLLQCRWLVVTTILMVSYGFALALGESQMLVSLGSLSFIGLVQLAPATLGALFWRKGNQNGALLGLGAGVSIWTYTMLVPLLIDQGWLPITILQPGPWGIGWLRPDALFGIDFLPATTQSLLLSLLLNSVLYVLGSLYLMTPKSERELALQFVNVNLQRAPTDQAKPIGLRGYILADVKLEEARQVLNEYLPEVKTNLSIAQIAEDLHIKSKQQLTMIELVEFHWRIEQCLAGSIGAPAAHRAMEAGIHYSEKEAAELKIVHNHILAELQCLPLQHEAMETEHKSSVDAFAEQRAVIAQLQQKVQQLEQSLDTEREKDFQHRLEIQRLKADKRELKEQLADLRYQNEREDWQRQPTKRSKPDGEDER